MKPTKETYEALELAIATLGRCLFDDALPACMITFARKDKTRGYFSADRWVETNGETHVHEIALNPTAAIGRTTDEIVSTLAHELCHLWQSEFGKPSRSGYHNKEWAAKMVKIGLQPSDTGAPGGKETGQKMTHYIIRGGRFDNVMANELAKFQIPYIDIAIADKTMTRPSKTKFSCPECEQNAWAKPDASLICGLCETPMLDAS